MSPRTKPFTRPCAVRVTEKVKIMSRNGRRPLIWLASAGYRRRDDAGDVLQVPGSPSFKRRDLIYFLWFCDCADVFVSDVAQHLTLTLTLTLSVSTGIPRVSNFGCLGLTGSGCSACSWLVSSRTVEARCPACQCCRRPNGKTICASIRDSHDQTWGPALAEWA